MLNVQQLVKHYGGQTVLNGVTFQINDRDRASLVGPNGAGKSTLLKIILRELEPDRGTIAVTPGTRVAYLAQDSQVDPGRTLQLEMESVFDRLNQLLDEEQATTAQMHGLEGEDPELLRLVDHHAYLLHEYERLGGYTRDVEIGRVLSGLGFSEADRSRDTGEFSGGWQMRIALAKLLLQAPDILLLDEPTNHLDIAAVEWLEDYLKAYRGAVLIVSHDRYVLDRVTTRTLELEGGAVRDWPGNYTWYVNEKERLRAEQESAYKRQQDYVEKQRAFIEKFRAKPSKTSVAQSREKFLEKMQDDSATRGKRSANVRMVEAPKKSRRGIKFRFPECPPSGRDVLLLRKISKSFGDLHVLKNVNLQVERGDRIALVGPNGAGKSTLLRIMAEVDQPDKGSQLLGHNVRPSYFAQHQADILNVDRTVVDEVYEAAPPTWTEEDVRGLLGRFLFSNDDVFKKIGVLSGGERSRVALAKMLLRPANLLFLDEPTNHLDIAGREVLEQALQDYPGTFVIISHDRYLLDRVANKIVDIADGEVRLYVGNYTQYREQKAVQARTVPLTFETPAPANKAPKEVRQTSTGTPSAPAAPARPAKAGAGSSAAPVHRSRSDRAQRRSDSSQTVTAFSQRRLEQIEQQIMTLEAEKAVKEAEMANPDLYRDGDRWPSLLAEFEAVTRKLDDLNRQWNQMAMRAAEENADAALSAAR